MANPIEKKLKTALDETRLLILGVQVMLGFQFQAAFQDGFETLAPHAKLLSLLTLALLIVACGLLIAPSMQHRIVERDRVSNRLFRATTLFTGLSLPPVALAMGIAAYIVIGLHFGVKAGLIVGAALGGLAFVLWFGVEMAVGRATQTGSDNADASPTPLSTKVEQVLTEARIIIPGAQALFGFQFVATLTHGFAELPHSAKVVHAIALCLIAINICLLMTPAALHRLSFGGEDSERFLRMASGLVIAAPVFLAAGAAAEMYVVFLKVLDDTSIAVAAAMAAFICLMTLWYALPLALRQGRSPR